MLKGSLVLRWNYRYCRGYRVVTFTGVGGCLYQRVREHHYIYKFHAGLTVLQRHLAGSKTQTFFIHLFVMSLIPVRNFSICIGSGTVV